jgi:hypothetical protein
MPIELTREDVKKLGLRPMGRKHPVWIALETMETGAIIYITRNEFTWKSATPLRFINKIEKTTSKKFSISESLNRMGWVVERMA